MIRTKAFLALALATLAGSAHAITSFFDNFDEDAVELAVTSTTNFTVTNAAANANVDVIGPGLFDLFPGNGNYIDLDGSYNSVPAIFATKQTFDPGVYTLSFTLGGSTRGDTNLVTVSLGTYLETLSIPSAQPLTLYTRTVTVPTASSLSFVNAGVDNLGGTLAMVSVQSTPEPGTMVALGLGGFALLRRRRTH